MSVSFDCSGFARSYALATVGFGLGNVLVILTALTVLHVLDGCKRWLRLQQRLLRLRL